MAEIASAFHWSLESLKALSLDDLSAWWQRARTHIEADLKFRAKIAGWKV